MCSFGTYIWAFVVRYRYTSQVCSGDFIGISDTDETSPVIDDQIKDEYYLIEAGKLLMCYLIIESLFVFCCMCSAGVWTFAVPKPLERISTTVEYSSQASHKALVQERLSAFKRMKNTEMIIFENERILKEIRERHKNKRR